MTDIDEGINLFPQDGHRVFTKKSEEGQFIANTVVEFPIDPRALLAGMAMQGILANPNSIKELYDSIEAIPILSEDPEIAYKLVATKARFYADALLQELDKSK